MIEFNISKNFYKTISNYIISQNIKMFNISKNYFIMNIIILNIYLFNFKIKIRL